MAAAVPDLTSMLYTIWSQREHLYPRISSKIHCGLNKVIGPLVNRPLGAGVIYWLSLDRVPYP